MGSIFNGVKFECYTGTKIAPAHTQYNSMFHFII